MNKFDEFTNLKLAEIANVIEEDLKSGKVPEILVGTGEFSGVFFVDANKFKCVYKITQQGKNEDIQKVKNKLDKLYDSGVNVQTIYMIDNLKISPNKMHAILNRCDDVIDAKDKNDKAKYYKLLSKVLKAKDSYLVSWPYENIRGMYLKYIKGNTIFKKIAYPGIDEDDISLLLVIAKTDKSLKRNLYKIVNDPAIKECINNTINRLDLYNSISLDHLSKFILDAIKIESSGLNIDTESLCNVLYHKDTGFTFIDLGLYRRSRPDLWLKEATEHIYKATIDSFSKSLTLPIELFDNNLSVKYLNLKLNLYNAAVIAHLNAPKKFKGETQLLVEETLQDVYININELENKLTDKDKNLIKDKLGKIDYLQKIDNMPQIIK